MKTKRIIALLLVIVMVLTLTNCSKKTKEEGSSDSSTTDSSSSQIEEESAEASDEDESENEEEVYNEDPEVQAKFDEFVDKQYKTSIESSYFTMHMYYLDPEKAGLNLDNVDITFGEAPTPEANKEDREYYQDLKKELETFDRSKLSPFQRDEYDALDWEINIVLKMLDEKFDYYPQLFATPNSLDQNIISYMSTYELRSEREVQEVIKLIDSIPAYVESSIEYAKKQQELELLMTNFSEVVSGCEDVLNTGTESSVLAKLLEKVDALEEISADNKETYKKQITDAFSNSYLPSFQKIIDAMNEMKDGYNNTDGYTVFPFGKEYFEVLLNYSMGLMDVSAEEIYDYIEKREEKHIDYFQKYMMETPDAMVYLMGEEETSTEYNDYTEILEEVKTKMLTDHPEVKDLKYHVEPADEEEKLDEKNIAAYFIIPPVDGDHKQQMRINPSTENVDTLESYTTITHEGFPGHMYQYAYIYDNIQSDYMKTLGVDGNVEGYAVYSQYYALDYLDNISDAEKAVNRLNSELSYLLYAKADIGINYKGWNLQDLIKFLNDAGYGLDDESVKEIYDFLRCSPGVYEPYGYGYELIVELREKAEEELGDKFNALEFNKALLDAGPSPYVIVKRHINDFIKAAKG